MKELNKILLLLLSLTACFNIKAKDITVSPDGVIKSIKVAVAISSGGDRIIIKTGTYRECNIEIEKQLELIGESHAIIDAEGKSEIITVKSDGVKISGLILMNSAFSSRTDYAAIRIENSKNCTVENCLLQDNYFSVYLANSSFCIIKGNTIISNAKSESSSGNGVHSWKCNNIIIENNNISGNRDGIYFEFTTNSRISGNISENNIRYGLHFMFSNSDDYENNTFRQNGAGVAVMYTKNVTMKGNRFEDNWGGNAYGLLLKEITDSHVLNNVFYKNTVGLYSEGGSRLLIDGNTFIENGWANKILGNCNDDTIMHNNYISNTFDVATNSSHNVNLYSENYWDKYKGYDLDKDSFGDVQYRPVSLFSMFVEETPETIVLLHSFIVDILDITEKVIPVFIPETLVDDKPKMEQWKWQ